MTRGGKVAAVIVDSYTTARTSCWLSAASLGLTTTTVNTRPVSNTNPKNGRQRVCYGGYKIIRTHVLAGPSTVPGLHVSMNLRHVLEA